MFPKRLRRNAPALGTLLRLGIVATIMWSTGCTQRSSAPVLRLPLNMSSRTPQVATFVLPGSGAYQMDFAMELSHPPTGATQMPVSSHRLIGTIVIHDAGGREILCRPVSLELGPGVIGAHAGEFNGMALGGAGRYDVTVTMKLDAAFSSYYSGLVFIVAPRPGFSLFD